MKRVFAIIVFLLHANVYAQSRGASTGDHGHPVNPSSYWDSSRTSEGLLYYEYSWESSTGNKNDLKEVWVGEYVEYSDAGHHYRPDTAWMGDDYDPTILPLFSVRNGPYPPWADAHSPPNHMMPKAGPACNYTATQIIAYRCFKCDPWNGPETSSEWKSKLHTLLGPYTITRYVENVNGQWQYRITKGNDSNTHSLP